MHRRHLPWDRIAAELEQGHLSRELAEEVIRHLADRCPGCHREEPLPSSATRLYGDAVRRALAKVSARAEEAATLREEAERDLAQLAKLPASERRGRIRRSFKRYRNPVLVDLCLEQSRRNVHESPYVALDWAECAQELALQLPHERFGSPLAMTCLARANAWRANALRASGRLAPAASLLEGASRLFAHEGTGDPLVKAELASLVASLRKDQRHFHEAQRSLDVAINVYRRIGETTALGRALVKQADLYKDLALPFAAIAAVDEALKLIEPAREPSLYLAAQLNRTHYLADLARFAEAQTSLAGAAALEERFPAARLGLRLGWLRGKIAHGLGQLEEAEEAFRTTRRQLQASGHDYDAALAGLDLALVYIARGKTGPLKELAAELVAVFQLEQIERETFAALLLFQQAVLQEAATAAMVAELIPRIARLPRRRIEQPS